MWHFRKLAAASEVLSVKRYTYHRSSGTPPIYTHIRKSIFTAPERGLAFRAIMSCASSGFHLNINIDGRCAHTSLAWSPGSVRVWKPTPSLRGWKVHEEAPLPTA